MKWKSLRNKKNRILANSIKKVPKAKGNYLVSKITYSHNRAHRIYEEMGHTLYCSIVGYITVTIVNTNNLPLYGIKYSYLTLINFEKIKLI